MPSREQFWMNVLVLLLLYLSTIQSGCKWDPSTVTSQKYCSITCQTDNPLSVEKVTSIMTSLTKEYSKRSNCTDVGIDVMLKNLQYSDDGSLTSGFFTANVNAKKLSVNLLYCFIVCMSYKKYQTIEVNAFNSVNLKSLEELEISEVNFTPLEKGTFTGLDNLKVLKIKAKQLRFVQIGILDELSDTLEKFTLEGPDDSSDEIRIHGFTGSGAMEKLEIVKVQYNLATSIDKSTFVGLTKVRSLDLSNCQIQIIADGAFDLMASIELLILKKNKLTVISDGLFNFLLITNKTQIYLEENAFICDCDLMSFKLSLMEHSNFVGNLLCSEPTILHSYPLIETDFCATASPTSTASASSSLICVSADGHDAPEVSINSAAESMEIFETKQDGVVVQVDQLRKSSILIWFAANDRGAGEDIHCLLSPDSESSFRIENLVDNNVYTFCLMDLVTVAVSPLDCFSYIKKADSRKMPWIYSKNKRLVIGIAFVVCLLNILLGLVIKISINKLEPWFRSMKEPSVPSYHSSRASSMRRSKMSFMTSDSYMTRRTTNTTVQYFINGNCDAPPLPARPASMYVMDEPIYATIREIACIRAPDDDNLSASK
ncbi:Slit like 3 protein [Pseudolycoriella hygida]|uniref:Slit like 3 protein n=1 Tax=Pseudolycoriella hygida TaxID=35572 RepID=A0A9Q0MS62_9DIPT|nr:Slit like 3 protein [Pseudolycoriella hygida]